MNIYTKNGNLLLKRRMFSFMDSLLAGVFLYIYLVLMKSGCEFLFRRMTERAFSYEVRLLPSYMLVFSTSYLLYIFSFEFPGKIYIKLTMYISLILFSLLVWLRLLKPINGRWYNIILKRIQK
jgi:hypothetical protein